MAIQKAGYRPAEQIYLGLDAAASEFYDKKKGYALEGVDRPALAAAVADQLVLDAMAGELLDPPRMGLVADIGEDDDVGDLADPPERLARSRHQRLAVHFGAEEFVEQWPDALVIERLAGRYVGQRLGEQAAVEIEADAMGLVQPVGEMGEHVQQHFVAVGDQQWPAAARRWRRGAHSSCALAWARYCATWTLYACAAASA